MNDEITEQTLAIVISGGKVTTRILEDALRQVLRSQLYKGSQQHSPHVQNHGKQTLKSLKAHNVDLSNIQITDDNIRSFERYARKYQIDYALKKDRQSNPPRYYVFFKGRDVESMKAAFREYTEHTLTRGPRKPSILKDLQQMIKKVDRQLTKTRTHDKELSR